MMSDATTYTYMDSPIGRILLARVDEGLTHLLFDHAKYPAKNRDTWTRDDASLRDTVEQLREYFAGDRLAFDLSLAPAGTPFQKKVWAGLRTIPCGETRSYGQLAAQIGFPEASRAVGAANGRNPIGIIVPCHRVIGANGSLTGFAGGLHVKHALLEHERTMVRRPGEQMALA
jgi:methylated-DNA-[protein]-cysteine S-methyltransferase